jgi:cobalt/nickel transport system permease protein
MHIPDGILPVSVCAAGYAVTGAVTWYSMRRINKMEDPQASIPKAALLASAFFVASWIHIPVPPVSVHLILNGLMGVMLGWFAFPAILIGLFFQAIMFNHGGLTTLGVNAAMMGLPALAGYGIFQLRYRFGGDTPANLTRFAFAGGALGVGTGRRHCLSDAHLHYSRHHRRRRRTGQHYHPAGGARATDGHRGHVYRHAGLVPLPGKAGTD